MNPESEKLLQRLQALAEKIHRLGGRTVKDDQKEQAGYAERCLNALAATIIQEKPIFHVEPWHPLYKNLSLNNAGEMLLRLKGANNEPLPPYPAIMTFYGNGLTEELDTILCLCALNQFRQQQSEKQVSINISCRSLQYPGFISSVLEKLESMRTIYGEKIIFEIHESNAVIDIDKKVIRQFRKLGVAFAMDDVGLSMNDIFRLSAFEDIADYIKLDRATVNANAGDPRSLKHVLALAKTSLPRAHMVAEGIQSTTHAREIIAQYPDIKYVQGMYLPDRETFKREWGT